MKKKILILSTLSLVIICALFLIPSRKANAAQIQGVEVTPLSQFARLSTPCILFIVKSDNPYIEFRAYAEESPCYISLSYYNGDLDIYHDCADSVHFKIYENDELIVFDFLINDYFPIEEVECTGLEYFYVTTDRNIIPVPPLDKLYKLYYGIYHLENDITFCTPEVFSSYNETTQQHIFETLINKIGSIRYDEGYSEGVSSGEGSSFEEGYSKGKEDGINEGYSNGLKDGKQSGINEGYSKGKEDGINEGYSNGYDEGKKDGINIGRSEGENVNADFGEMILSILDAPREAISNMLNFEFLGINFANLVFFLISSALVFAIIKFFI